MAIRKSTAIGAFGIVTVLALTSCSGSTGAGNAAAPTDGKVPEVDGKGKKLTVWVMENDYTAETLDAINAEFTEITGAEVSVQSQTWDGITTKITTALATDTPPDVLDVGNTQIASYAANGGLLDLTPYQDDLAQGQTWLDGLVDPATIDGSLYGVPGFAGARAVIYNKKMWADAGVTAAPTTYEELTAALDKVKAANAQTPDFSAFYLPGQYFYAGMQFVWDAGGEIATEEDGEWASGLGSPEAVEGLEAFQEFQNEYSTAASATLDTFEPNQSQLFADGKASAILNTNTGAILKINPALETDLGTFPLPGISGEAQPVMLGGSDWAIPVKSKNSDLALNWVKIAASPEIQKDHVFGVDGWIPNSVEGIEFAQESLDDVKASFFTAALRSKATPANANWTTIESNKAINNLFSSIASGAKTAEEAASDFDADADKTLNTP
ncbi:MULTISPECIES: extracellular solute-binding protein [unclassified Microbacterium]|uniref:extracellular solute-binding protein n=1 Tax=unclassified Microbacterium TaxID=2609290 RepID=UPI000EA97A38|nr:MULTISPECIES: extracellular solute-binding protein [unclassified Microbacterium]MBT2484440.1 extracellular solute-binding protein [Microbacterium sp. ISL-108]RKN67348.1 extracellular solute-binding protein [Microbacterium sp. CGR2]